MTRDEPIDSRRSPLPLFPAIPFDLVVIAASAGGVPAVKQVLDELPASFPAPIAVVHHLSADHPSLMAQVLGSKARMPAAFAADGERLRAGNIRVAPRGHHLVVTDDRRYSLIASEKVNRMRPAADPLFETAAAAFGPRVIAVIMSGMGRDGSEGARHVKRGGGIVIVQDPRTAIAASMPQAAIDMAEPDLVLEVLGVAHALVCLVAVQGTMDCLGLPRQAADNALLQ